jgi:hypothetical protein
VFSADLYSSEKVEKNPSIALVPLSGTYFIPGDFATINDAAFATLVIGFVWYNPKVFGTIWMNETGMTEERAKQGNMLKIFGFTFLFSLMISFATPGLVIHQMGAFGMIGGDEAKALPSYAAFLADYGDKFRTFKHGALHGLLSGLFIALPIIGVNAMFDQKSWKYIFITAGYWTVTLIVMGAIICGWK